MLSLSIQARGALPDTLALTALLCMRVHPCAVSIHDANGRGSYLLALLVLLCMRVHSCARLPIRPMCSHCLPMHAIGSITASGLTSCECFPTQAAGSGISRSHYGCSSLHPLVSKPAFNLHAGMPVESKPFKIELCISSRFFDDTVSSILCFMKLFTPVTVFAGHSPQYCTPWRRAPENLTRKSVRKLWTSSFKSTVFKPSSGIAGDPVNSEIMVMHVPVLSYK